MKIDQKEIEESIKEIIGEEALILINELRKRKNQNEFNLAEKLNLTINQVRNLIYKLDNHNLVSSIRKKDKKKGWYVYYWTYHPQRAKNLVIAFKERRIAKLTKRVEDLKRETYYSCPRKCIVLPLVTAMEENFRCPECSSLLSEEVNEKEIKTLNKQIESLKKELEEVRLEEAKEPKQREEKKVVKLKEKPKIIKKQIKPKEKIQKKKIQLKQVPKKQEKFFNKIKNKLKFKK